jgi:hypothetical protein
MISAQTACGPVNPKIKARAAIAEAILCIRVISSIVDLACMASSRRLK